MQACRDMDMLSNGKHHPSSTRKSYVKGKFSESKKLQLTLPQLDLAFAVSVLDFCVASDSSSSANPQEQFLQAFRLPVVPQTEHYGNNNYYYILINTYLYTS